MKRRILCLLLATVMCVSLCACSESASAGGDNKENSSKEENTTEENTTEQQDEEIRWEMDGRDLIVYVSSKQLINSLKTITITKDNYSDYYGDYEYVHHYVDENAFGEIVEERDEIYRGFSLKKNVCARIEETVAFKFLGKTYIDSDGNKWVYEIGKKTMIYDKNGEFVREAEPVEQEYYYVERGSDAWYDAYECIDAVGKITIIDLPCFNLEADYADVYFQFPNKDYKIHVLEFWTQYDCGFFKE